MPVKHIRVCYSVPRVLQHQVLAEQYGREVRISDERVDADEVATIVHAAAAARAG
jgi:hypothetical protein